LGKEREGRGKVSKGGGERYTKGLIDGFGMRRMRGRLVCACGIGMPGGGVLTANDRFVAALWSSQQGLDYSSSGLADWIHPMLSMLLV